MKINTKRKTSWIEITIDDGNTVIHYDIWKNELKEFKESLESAISDIDHLIEKLNETT